MNTPLDNLKKTNDLTPRQLEALEAALLGKPITARKRKGSAAEVLGEWKGGSSMGGASYRMADALREAGYLQAPARHRMADDLNVRSYQLPHMSRDLMHDPGGLSVKGLEALDAHLRGGRRYDPTDTRLALIRDQLAKRRELDAAYEAFMVEYKTRENAKATRRVAAKQKAQLANIRLALVQFGFGSALNEQLDSDEHLLKFAKAIRGAEFGNDFVKYMDDTDLQAELEETKAETQHRPGTLGATMRDDKLVAIKAEQERRAKHAA
jgi:hypothetical protein